MQSEARTQIINDLKYQPLKMQNDVAKSDNIKENDGSQKNIYVPQKTCDTRESEILIQSEEKYRS